MAKIDVVSLQRQAERAEKRSFDKRIESVAREIKELQKKAKPKAREIVRSLPGLLKKEARRGGNEVTVLDSSSISDKRLFKEVTRQVSSYCWRNNLASRIQKHEQVGIDDYPYHETLVVGFRRK